LDSQNLDAEDEEALAFFMVKNGPARTTLANIIMDKVKEKETEIMTLASERGEIGPEKTVNPKVVAVYEGSANDVSYLRRKPSPWSDFLHLLVLGNCCLVTGRVPCQKLSKSFRPWRTGRKSCSLPTLTRGPTRPCSRLQGSLPRTSTSRWHKGLLPLFSPGCIEVCDVIAQPLSFPFLFRFFNLVLLPRVRDDFRETKKINYHLYMAIKKALYKPAAFFKGLLLPICEARDCSLREAAIIGSVITKVSIPMLHSSAALLKIVEMEYSGVNSLFIRVLLDKKYALPFRVIDALVFHFIRFHDEKRQMPVLWHQSLLIFIQRYKEDITSEQKEAILELVKKQQHYSVSPEVRREIMNSKSRGEVTMEEDIDLDFGYTSD